MQIFIINGISDDEVWDVHGFFSYDDAKKEFIEIYNDYIDNGYEPSGCDIERIIANDDYQAGFNDDSERFWIEEITVY